MIIAKPLGTFESTGINLKAQLRAIADRMQSRVGRLFFCGRDYYRYEHSIYRDSEAETTVAGRMFPAAEPSRVPALQPR